MQYAEYRKKIMKLASVLGVVKRFRVLIISVCLLAVALITVLLSVRGIVYEVSSCPQEIVYGDNLGFKAKAVMGGVVYQYSADGEHWSAAEPVRAGNYMVRPYSKSVTGKPRYGKAHAFAILPKQIEVRAEDYAVYGDNPVLIADLSFADRASCSKFEYGDIYAETTDVLPDKNSVVITDKNGADVTSSYVITIVKTDITFTKRSLTVAAESAEKEYDGTPLTANGHDLCGTSLAFEDRVVFSGCEGSRTEAGSAENRITGEVKIYNQEGDDVTGRYNLSVTSGLLTVNKRVVCVTTESAEKEYDGEPLSCTDFSDDGRLVLDHILKVTSLTSITGAGEKANALGFTVTGEGGDKTANYDIQVTPGVLTVTRRKITVTTEDKSWVYGGVVYSWGGHEVTDGSLVDGHTSKAYNLTTITDVGTAENGCEISVFDSLNANVTANYEITVIKGTLTVTEAQLIIYSEDYSWTYDGTAHGWNGYRQEGLAGIHTIVSTAVSDITEVGTCENEIEVRIYSGGKEVTSNYHIEYFWGELEITARPVTVTADSAEKVYDGTPLTCGGVSADNLVNGHTVTGETYGIRTDAGEEVNGLLRRSVVIHDANGKDVTSNYDITIAQGFLKVNPRPITVKTADGEWTYDGAIHSAATFEFIWEKVSTLNLGYSIESYTEICDAGEAENAITIEIYANGKLATSNFEITYDYGTLKVNPRPVTVTTGSASKVYDGKPLTCLNYNITSSLSPALVQYHYAEVTFTGAQTNAGTGKNTADVKILSDDGDKTANYAITVNEGNLTVTKRPVTIISYGGEWRYDGAAHSRSTYRISDEKGMGLAAGAAVEIQSLTEIVNVGSLQNVIVVKIIVPSMPWDIRDVTENYNITYEYGILTVTPRPVTVTAGSAEKPYDGTPLICGTVSGDNLPLVTGHVVTAKTTGSQTEVGESANRVIEGTAAVHDENGGNVTSNYTITLADGVLKVTPCEITVKAGDSQKIYDGDPLTCAVYYVASENKLYAGHNLTAQTTGSQTAAGEGENIIVPSSVKIADRYGRDVTADYIVNCESGLLTVTPRPISVIASDAEKEYDGTPLTCGKYEVFSDYDPALVKDHRLTAVITGSQTAVGEGDNVVESVSIISASGDVTGNYAIVAQNGKLTVTGRQLTVTTADGEWVYDGENHSKPEIECDGLLAGHTTEFDFVTTTSSACKINNVITVKVYSGSEEVTGNYVINYVYGTFTINKREVRVTTGGGEWVYDGAAHSKPFAEVDEDSPYGLVEGHEFSYSNMTEITTVGEASNKLALGVSDGAGQDKTSNYDLHLTYGTLKVTKRPVTITYRYDNIYFTGAPLNQIITCSYYSYFESVSDYPLLKETFVTVTVLCDEYGLGEATLYFQEGSAKITDYNKNDLTRNYEITLQSKQVNIAKRTIKLQSVDAEKVYDGTPLTAEEFGVDSKINTSTPFMSDSLVSGHEISEIETTFTGSQTEIGECLNTFTVDSFKVTDGEGNDITYGYTVKEIYGGLYITEFGSLYVTTAGARKIYDGTPLTNDIYNVKSTLSEGYTYEITVTGSQTEVGSSRNTFDVVVYSPEGDDVTAGLRLVDDLGWLEVVDKPDKNDGDLDLSGSIGGGGGVAGSKKTVALKVYSEYGGPVYMRLQSYGDYTGTGWTPANPYTQTIDGKYGMNYLTGFALGGTGRKSYNMHVRVMGSMYYLPYYLASGDYGYEVQQSDVLYSGDTSVIYSLYYYPYNYLTEGAVKIRSNLSEAELAYRQFVHDNYLTVPYSTAEYLETVISAQGFNINDKNLVGKIAAFVQSSATYNLNYDTALDEESDAVVSFLRDYKEGVCRHYASAATLLYRMMGIPARYTVGYAGDTAANGWVDITTDKAHAWVEIYVDGTGWVQIEVTGSSDSEYGEIDLGMISPADVTKEYDGTPLVANRLVESGRLKELLKKGFTYKAKFGGSRTDVGTSYSWVTDILLYDSYGKPVLRDVIWTSGSGRITVVKTGSLITVHLYYLGCEYDGRSHSLGSGDWYAEGLPEGHSLIFNPSSISVTEANGFDWEALKALPLKLYNASGYDVTDNYNIIFSYESAGGCDGEGIDISRRQLTVCTQSAEKVYDGTPLENGEWWISFGTLAAGHKIVVNVSGFRIDAGREPNKISSYKIFDKYGNDVTDNYKVTCEPGTLTVID